MSTAANGLFRRVLDGDGFIVLDAWVQAVSDRFTVGQCRSCDGALFGAMPSTQGSVTWFAARCSGCGHEVWSPNGRTAPGSSARSRMRPGGWAARDRALKQNA